MIHFADPYPDELLFSAWVRSAEQLQYPNKYAYFAEITGNQRIKPIVDFPCHLDQFVAALPVPSSYPVETLIREHTLYPYYQPFLPADRAQMLYEQGAGARGICRERTDGLKVDRSPHRRLGTKGFHALGELPGDFR
jgi:hypothetical protein